MIKLRKIMASNVPRLRKDAKVEEAAKLLVATQSGCVVIVENKSPIGILTELDLVRNFGSSKKTLKGPVSKIMSSPVTSMPPDMNLDNAIRIIDTKGFKKYPVVENGELAGLVSKKDVVHAMSDNLRMHRNIQNVVLLAFVLFEIFVLIFYRFIPLGA